MLNFFRSLSLLVVVPFMTLLVSVLTLVTAVFLRWPATRVQAFPRLWGRVIAWFAGVPVRVEGYENLGPGKSYIFAANHLSQFDIVVLSGFFEYDLRWLAKKELFKIPLFGRAMLRADYISVDRSHGRAAMKSLVAAARRIAGGASVIIFPEGTRSPDGKLQPFKAGAMHLAMQSGVDLVPVAIIGTHEILPKGKFFARPGPVLIRVGQPLITASFNPKQKGELAERLHDEVERLINEAHL
ncbi:MAG: 1-acyl-sn-glycerol-3-phosphate acyltransferase [Proteobacteria bacterium]|nr:1-acyl-sn-glycerol-3-phosphate acyltransferase [Pseudomonadota bacterium]MBU1687373.1 1-acyl-sn-glycerol-3-phosphate acyltransferase [Pseudomonadota bacterium]